MTADAIGATLAGLLTLAIFSFLYRDNPVYKFAENLFVGLASGYYLATEFHQVFRPNLWDPLVHDHRLINLIPLLLVSVPLHAAGRQRSAGCRVGRSDF